MCKVPGIERGRAVLFAVTERLVRTAAARFVCGLHMQWHRKE